VVVRWRNWGGEVLHSDIVVKGEPGTTRQKKTKGLENQRKLEKNKKCREKQMGFLHFKQSKI